LISFLFISLIYQSGLNQTFKGRTIYIISILFIHAVGFNYITVIVGLCMTVK